MQDSNLPRWLLALVAIALTALVLGVFLPILDFELIVYDVDDQVVKNPYIRQLTAENLLKIFTSRSLTSYYPVRTLSFAIDYQFWGLNPRGFKLTNLLLHLANTGLVFWLILQLFCPLPGTQRSAGRSAAGEVCAAGLAAGVFAVHPVVVEPVTWIAGREELLMTLGALGCLHCHLAGRRWSAAGGGIAGARGYRAGAVLCCTAACLSNAAGAVIPLLVTAGELLAVDRAGFRRIVRDTWLFWVIGAITIALKKLGSGGELLAGQAGVLSVQRLLTVLDLFWLNLRTLLWPRKLAILYADSVPPSFLETGVMLGGLALLVVGALFYLLRRHKLILLGLAWFGLALAPSSQIVPHHWIRADRFLYLPLLGLTIAVAAGVWLAVSASESVFIRSSAGRRAARVSTILAGVLVILLLGRISVAQVAVWRNNISLWEHCIRVSPGSAVAHGACADALTRAGQFQRAISHYQTALQIDPNDWETLNNFALELAANADSKLRDYERAIALARRGGELTHGKSQKLRRTLAIALNNLALELERRREYPRAAQYYEEAAGADPLYEAPLFNLALLLATCGDETVRRPVEAVAVAERACQTVQHPDANGLLILALAYGEAGRSDQAAAATQMAFEVARATGNQELADRIQASWKRAQDQP